MPPQDPNPNFVFNNTGSNSKTTYARSSHPDFQTPHFPSE